MDQADAECVRVYMQRGNVTPDTPSPSMRSYDISACEKGRQWSAALQVRMMSRHFFPTVMQVLPTR
eukprot:798066-Pyramimonas_sp.AAC.2